MKKIVFGLLCAIASAVVVFVYGIGGQLGAYAWNAAVFIIAPLAVIAALMQGIVLIVALIKRRSWGWSAALLLALVALALPIGVLLGVSPIVYPADADAPGGITVKTPVKDAVLFGGADYKTHAMWPSECYAYDLLKEPYDMGSALLTDYGIFASDVEAPIAGTVIALENKEPDIAPNTEDFTSALGNYICIEIDETGTYLILAHLKQNSVTVKTGDHVEPGQIIGKVGNSGTTSEPHLHVQHQRNNPADVRFPVCAEGLPIRFSD